MSPKLRRAAGLVLVWLVGLALIASAGMKLAAPPFLLERMGDSGFLPLLLPLGVVEIVAAVLLLVPKTWRLGLLLCTAYLGGAIAVSIESEGLGEAVPAAVLQALLWTGAALRTPDLLGPLFPGRGTAAAPAAPAAVR